MSEIKERDNYCFDSEKRKFCALCLGEIGDDGVQRAILKELRGADKEIMIPKGLHHFHFQCWPDVPPSLK